MDRWGQGAGIIRTMAALEETQSEAELAGARGWVTCLDWSSLEEAAVICWPWMASIVREPQLEFSARLLDLASGPRWHHGSVW